MPILITWTLVYRKRDALEFYQYTEWCNAMRRFVLKEVSASMRRGFGSVFRFNGTFVFCCPRTLDNFFIRINSFMRATSSHQNHLKHIVLEIFDHYNGCGRIGNFDYWAQIAEIIPPDLLSLQMVKLDLGEIARRRPDKKVVFANSPRVGDACGYLDVVLQPLLRGAASSSLSLV